MARRNKRGGRRDPVLPELAQPARAVPRRKRVENDVLREVVAALQSMADRRLAAASVTRVRMTDDLKLAKIYVRLGPVAALEAEAPAPAAASDEAHDPKRLLDALGVARGRLRRHLASALGLRYTPELRFYYDEGVEAAARVDELLDEIRRDDEQRSSE